MASTAQQYPNSDSGTSQKWRRDLTPWFECCDLPDHLRATVLVMLRRDRFGMQLWMCKTRLAVELGVCRRTAQRRVKRLVELQVLRKVAEANTYPFPDTRPEYFRHSTTYEARPDAVGQRPTWKDFESLRPTHQRLKVKSATQHFRRHSHTVTPISSLPQAPEPAASTTPSSAAAPVPAPYATSVLGGHRGVRETRVALMNLVTALQKPRKHPQGSVRSQCELQLARSAIEPKLASSPDPWAEILYFLKKRINPHSFDTWLKPTKFRSADGKTMFVTIPVRDFGHIGEKFRELIQEAIADSLLGYERIIFEWTEPVMQEAPALPFEAAVREACRQLAIPLMSANEITGWKVKPESGS
jgi:hypothetical protein